MFEKMSVKTRLMLVAGIPVVAMLVLAVLGSLQKYGDYRQQKDAQVLVKLVVSLAEVAHELQRERGMSSGFLSSKGSKFGDQLPNQRRLADEKIKALREDVARIDPAKVGPRYIKLLENVGPQLDELSARRERVSALALEPAESFRFYSDLIAYLLEITTRTGNQMPTARMSRIASAKMAFLYLKERTGQERALLSGAFATGRMSPVQFNTFLTLMGDQSSFSRLTLSYATAEQEAHLKEKLADPIVREIETIEQAVRDKGANAELNYSAEDWFAKVSAKIDLLRSVEERFSADLYKEIDTNLVQARNSLLFYLLIVGLTLALTLWLGVTIMRGLMRQLGGEPAEVREALVRVGRGDLGTEVVLRPGDDESLMYALKGMQDSLRGIVGEIRQIVDAAANRGDLGLRMQVDGKAGFMRDLSELLNRFCEVTETGLKDVTRVAGALAAGDLSQRIEKTYPGLFGQTGAGVNRTVDALNVVVSEIRTVVDAAANRGDFSVKMEVSGKSGYTRTLADLLNQLSSVTDGGLKDIRRVAQALANGDLTQTVSENYPGVFGQTTDAINMTVDNLQSLVGDIKVAVEAINTAAKEIAAGNTDLSGRTEEQASSLEETASSMEELTSTVRLNAENAQTANDLSRRAQEVATRGGEVVGQVVETMGAIHQSSSKIADIIGVIDGIAFQTNILALNAAVEAARAGEQGRGFAVVATEVRNLAQRSAAAAKEIKGLISDSVDKVQSGTRLVDAAGRTMEEVVSSIHEVARLMSDISAASREQSSGIEQVSQAVGQMDEVTQQNAALVEEAAAAAESLEEQARELTRAVAAFQVADGSNSSAPRVAPPLLRGARPAKRLVKPKALASPASLDGEWDEF